MADFVKKTALVNRLTDLETHGLKDDGLVPIETFLDFDDQGLAPIPPDVGRFRFYSRGGTWYSQNSAGVETALSASILNNFTAIVDPTTSNDGTQGYAVGSMWVNTLTGREFVLVNPATGNADWRKMAIEGPNEILSAKGYGYEAVNTIASGATPEFDCANGDFQNFTMPDADAVLTFANPRIGAFSFIVNAHANSHTLTFPSAYYSGEASSPSVKVVTVNQGSGGKILFSMQYDGTSWYVTATPFTP